MPSDLAKATRPPRRRLYFSAKISDYRFRKVLACFVRDLTVAEAARETRLSANSVDAIFRKVRVYFYEVELFTDIHGGKSPLVVESDDPAFERDLIAFHLGRVRDKRGLKSPPGQPDYHFAESHWRYHFHILAAQRPNEQVYAMMLAHLIELIRLCGPIGKSPVNREAGLEAILRQMDQRIAWLERNAPDFRPAELRSALKAVREL